MNDHLRLAAVNGEPTIRLGVDPVLASLVALADAMNEGRIDIEKAIIVAEVDGMITYTPLGHVSIVEGIGMLEMASRKIERDARGE